MAIRVTSKKNGVMELRADTEADVANLPTQTKSVDGIGTAPTHSTCFVFGDGSGASLYGLKSDGVWVKM